MSAKSTLTRADYEDYLVYLCFGPFDPERDYLSSSINKAYLDFSRTQHGLSKVVSKDTLHEHATAELGRAFSAVPQKSLASQPVIPSEARNLFVAPRFPARKERLRGMTKASFALLPFSDFRNNLTSAMTQEEFDTWHRSVRQQLFAIYSEYGHHLFVGQAQKWINMTFKYIFALGERLPGFADACPFCHVPLDKNFITQLVRYNTSSTLLGMDSTLLGLEPS